MEKFLQHSIERNLITLAPNHRHGEAVISGTRFPVSRIFVEILAGFTPKQIAEDYGQDLHKIEQIILLVATELDLEGVRDD